ncbi:hypothetical protein YC2023_068436 [Brassica napus]
MSSKKKMVCKPKSYTSANHSKPDLGIKVHATCRNNNLKSLGDQCIVGECKTIENFQVSELGKELRPK